MTPQQDILSITAFFSALVHAVIILGISFKLPDIASMQNTDNTLDVILLSQPNNDKPTDAQMISTNDSVGGGNDDRIGGTPRRYKPVNAAPIESIKMSAEQQQQTVLAQDQFIQASNATLKINKSQPDVTKLQSKQRSRGSDLINTKSAVELERERKIQALQQRWEDYQKRPKKEFFSPSTDQHQAAKYLDDWRKKIESMGNANYPTQATSRKLKGSLTLTVEINRDGTIAAIQINKPSRHKLLNDAAQRFVRNASPFASFPEEIDPGTDIFVITRVFHFLGDNRVSSSAAASLPSASNL